MRSILLKAEEKGFTSIALPTIGIGGLDYPSSLAAQIMLDSVFAFGKMIGGPKHLQNVTIVVYNNDIKAIKVIIGNPTQSGAISSEFLAGLLDHSYCYIWFSPASVRPYV